VRRGGVHTEALEDRQRILVVGDEVSTVEMLTRHLSTYRVTKAFTGEDAVKIAVEESFELILLDIVLPGIDGFEALKLLRSDPRTSKVPVLLLTSLADKKSVVRGFECGADDYLVKPVEPMELQARVGAQIDRQLMRRELLEAHKQETIQHIAHGLSHEINNPLYVIRGFAELLSFQATDGVAKEYISKILQSTDRITAVLKALRDYSSRPAKRIDLVDLNRVIHNAAQLASGALHEHNVRAHCSLTKAPLWVRGDLGELTHVFLHLMLGAHDSIPQGGALRVESSIRGSEVVASIREEMSEGRRTQTVTQEDPDQWGHWITSITQKDIVRRIVEKYLGNLQIEKGTEGFSELQLVFPSALTS